MKGSDTETQSSIAPLFTGYRSNIVGQKFTYAPNQHLALNAGLDYSYKITSRPETRADITGGTDYEMRYKGLRWNVGGIYKFTSRNSIQANFVVDRYRYGKEYDVETKTNQIGDYVHINEKAYTLAAYAQHEMKFLKDFTATLGLRLTHHETFNNHLTPKVALMYAPGEFRFRATYSAGFRAPGLDELYYHYYSVNRGKPQISFGNRDLNPEKSHYFSLNAEYRTQMLAVSLTE